MKINQDETEFKTIVIELESKEEANSFIELVDVLDRLTCPLNDNRLELPNPQRQMIIELSNRFNSLIY